MLSRENVYWGCRRGMLELDLFLQTYFNDKYDNLTKKDKLIFQELLTQTDPDLFSWLMGYSEPENIVLGKICVIIREHMQNKK